MDDELQVAEQRRRMIAEGVLNPDGSQRHSCPWCCQSFGFVLGGADLSYTSVREYLEQRPWWWRLLHPRRTSYLRGQWDAYADVLDDAGK